MKENRIRQIVLPLLTALIWGTAFTAQSIGAEYLESFTFNAVRAVIAAVILLPVSKILKRVGFGDPSPRTPQYRKQLLLGGVCCGTALTLASYVQQKGIETTQAGKAGFITALYIVIIPIAGIFLKKRPPKAVWVSVPIAVAGLYFLCMQEETFTIASGDFLLLLCAFCFAAQMLLVDHFVQYVDGTELSCVQFCTMSVLCGAGMFLTESPNWGALSQCLLPVLYVGIFSSGVGYTLQILAQKDTDPTVVSLILSLESVFATLSGAVILHDRMSVREWLGCGLMLAAVILAQLPDRKRR